MIDRRRLSRGDRSVFVDKRNYVLNLIILDSNYITIVRSNYIYQCSSVLRLESSWIFGILRIVQGGFLNGFNDTMQKAVVFVEKN